MQHKMKQLKNYINIRKGKSTIKATDETIKKIVKGELDRFGHDANLNHVDVSDITNMNDLFNCFSNLGESYKDINPDISAWNVSNVISMRLMFYNARMFNCNIGNWDVSNVKIMRSIFAHCESFNQDLSQWDVSNVENMYGMFYACKNFNQDLSMWDGKNVKDVGYMFKECPIKEEFKPKFKK